MPEALLFDTPFQTLKLAGHTHVAAVMIVHWMLSLCTHDDGTGRNQLLKMVTILLWIWTILGNIFSVTLPFRHVIGLLRLYPPSPQPFLADFT